MQGEIRRTEAEKCVSISDADESADLCLGLGVEST
jgi:hypothetical protein